MNSMKKRALALTLSLCMAAALLPGAALAAQEVQRGVLTYEEMIAPQYEDAQTFSEGLAAVKKDGKWGYIDTEGKTVIPFQYDLAFDFSEGLAVVGQLIDTQDRENWGWDPETGEYDVVGTSPYYIYELGFIDQSNKLTWFVGGRYDEEAGEYLENATYRLNTEKTEFNADAYIFYNGYIYLPDMESPDGYLHGTDGRRVTLEHDDNWRAAYGWQVTEGIVIVGDQVMEGGNQAFYDMATGAQILIQPAQGVQEDFTFDELRPFNQGLAPVGVFQWNPDTERYTGSWGFVDRTGAWVIQPTYSNFMVNGTETQYRVFGETGLAMMCNAAGQWGAINKSGQVVIPFQYEGLRPYYFGLAPFVQDGKYGYLDAAGQVAIPAQYVVTSGFGSRGYAVAYDGQKAFLIDAKGKEIPGADKLNPNTYFMENEDSDVPRTLSPEEYVVIQENGKYGFGHVEYLPVLPEPGEMNPWAYEEVTAAIEENLVPTYLQNLYLNNINRNEFCDLVIQAVEEVLDQEIEDVVLTQSGKDLTAWQREYPFQDTTSSNVIAAYALGIVSGRGNGAFDPYATITRQEAAAFLMRSAKVLGMDTAAAGSAGFTDGDAVGVWFTDAVNFVYPINVMGGVGDNQFNPLGTYTREQSYMTIYRLFQAIVAQA